MSGFRNARKSCIFTGNIRQDHLAVNKLAIGCVVHTRITVPLVTTLLIGLMLGSCAKPLPWPDSPLYTDTKYNSIGVQPPDIQAAKQALVGHYAHYDVVAYEDETTQTPMLTFIVSYGFTDFYLENGDLYQSDRFIHAEQKINQERIESLFRDEAVQAIEPRVQKVELEFTDGQWRVFRPATPTLLGITGDPSVALSNDPNDPNIIDPDRDGNPGVTVEIRIGGLISGEIYILRREIYSDYLTLNAGGILYGHVEDRSEQFVIGASLRILAQPSNAVQNPDYGLSPIILVPIPDDLDTADELMSNRDRLFPPEPEFRNQKLGK